MNHSVHITGESSSHKLAAVFSTRTEAEGIAQVLYGAAGLREDQVMVIAPDDPDKGHQLEPETQGILHTLIRSHLSLGVAGAVVGFVVFLILYFAGIDFIVLNGPVAASVLVALGAVCGLLVAGGISLRPDHGPYLVSAQAALRKGKYVLAVHADSLGQLEQVKAELQHRRVHVVRTV